MAVENGSGGTNDSGAGGANQNQNRSASGDDGDGGGSGTVSYETHRKLLTEKKKLQEQFQETKARLDAIENEKKEFERKKLEEQGEYKKLLDLERENAKKLQQQLAAHDEQQRAARKLDAVLKSVDGEIPAKYWGLIELADIVITPDTGEIDAMSVTKAVEKLRKNYPEIIFTKGQKNSMPNNAPQGNGAALSYDEWKKLGSAKEMKEKWSQVDQKTLPAVT